MFGIALSTTLKVNRGKRRRGKLATEEVMWSGHLSNDYRAMNTDDQQGWETSPRTNVKLPRGPSGEIVTWADPHLKQVGLEEWTPLRAGQLYNRYIHD